MDPVQPSNVSHRLPPNHLKESLTIRKTWKMKRFYTQEITSTALHLSKFLHLIVILKASSMLVDMWHQNFLLNFRFWGKNRPKVVHYKKQLLGLQLCQKGDL